MASISCSREQSPPLARLVTHDIRADPTQFGLPRVDGERNFPHVRGAQKAALLISPLSRLPRENDCDHVAKKRKVGDDSQSIGKIDKNSPGQMKGEKISIIPLSALTHLTLCSRVLGVHQYNQTLCRYTRPAILQPVDGTSHHRIIPCSTESLCGVLYLGIMEVEFDNAAALP